MEFSCLLNGERKRFGYRSAIVVLGRSVTRFVKQARRGGCEAFGVLNERDFEAFAIGRRLLMCERQSSQQFRQSLCGLAFPRPASPGNEVIGTNLFGPKADFDRLCNAAPSVRIRCDKYLSGAPTWQIGFKRVRSDRVI